MEQFLVNMAIVKVNWDHSQKDILDNYIPLVAHTLNEHPADTLSLENFKARFREVAEFDIPTGAIITLLKRANKKYGLLEKQEHGQFHINRTKLHDNNYAMTRDTERRRYHQLKESFVTYCTNKLNVTIDQADIDQYFFETLYEIAPALFARVTDIEHIDQSSLSDKQFLVSRFIMHASTTDNVSFEAILSFVRGAMLTETFYYSHPSAIQRKMRDVAVYFDTEFALRVLGYADPVLIEPCRELVEMLQKMGVKMRVFRHTHDEMHRIFHAAALQLLQNRRLFSRRPGDLFDYFNRNNSTSSDIELAKAKIESDLNKRKIRIDDKPPISDAYGVNETALGKYLETELYTQSDAARNHDIDSLTAIHRLRSGKAQDYLESCKAVFVTTNAALARTATAFFAKQYGRSLIPVCMGDQVFTTLAWLKAVNKVPDLPKEQLVASCYAATNPSEALWAKYVREAERLKSRGDLDENDYAILVHSLEARDKLMELTLGEDEILHGTVEEVLSSAKEKYTVTLNQKLSNANREIQSIRETFSAWANSIEKVVSRSVFYTMISAWILFLAYALLKSAPDKWTLQSLLSVDSAVFLVLIVISIVNMLFGVRMADHCRQISSWLGLKVRERTIRFLSGQ